MVPSTSQLFTTNSGVQFPPPKVLREEQKVKQEVQLRLKEPPENVRQVIQKSSHKGGGGGGPVDVYGHMSKFLVVRTKKG